MMHFRGSLGSLMVLPEPMPRLCFHFRRLSSFWSGERSVSAGLSCGLWFVSCSAGDVRSGDQVILEPRVKDLALVHGPEWGMPE